MYIYICIHIYMCCIYVSCVCGGTHVGEAGGVIDENESEEVRDALGLDRLCQRPRHLPVKRPPRHRPRGRELSIDNLLDGIHYTIEMIWWTGLAPWEFAFPFHRPRATSLRTPPCTRHCTDPNRHEKPAQTRTLLHPSWMGSGVPCS